MVTCPNCNVDDHLILLTAEDLKFESDEKPNISTTENYLYKCKECATETSTLNHGQCPFCGGDVMDLIDVEALKPYAAVEEDATMKSIPLPVPNEDKIPLETMKKKSKPKPGVFTRLFSRDKK